MSNTCGDSYFFKSLLLFRKINLGLVEVFCTKSNLSISVQMQQSKLCDNSICKRMWKGIFESKGENILSLMQQMINICNKPR